MRLEAGPSVTGWSVYDAKLCCNVLGVVWVDDATAQWGGYAVPHIIVDGRLAMEFHQEDRITIYVDRKLVVFNEVEDSEDDSAKRQSNVPACLEVA